MIFFTFVIGVPVGAPITCFICMHERRPSTLRWLVSIALCALTASSALASPTTDESSRSALEPSSLTESDTTRLLALEVDALTFFRDNEYDVALGDDYTLPGYRFRLNLDYTPPSRHAIRLRAGLSNLYFWGASLYPAGIFYSDLPYWMDEGSGYTRFRLRPFLQASIRPSDTWQFVLGNLDGGAFHGLIAPLYNPELHLTSDYETGLQIRHTGRRLTLDTWVDWRSFIFRRAEHQEAFVFGLSAGYELLPRQANSSLALRFQALSAHRGGVENIVPDTVHTWINSAIGLDYSHRTHLGRKPVTLSGAVYGVSYSQRGEHYPHDKGWGLYAEASCAWHAWTLGLSGWYGHKYIGILGSPFVQTVTLRGSSAISRTESSYVQLRGGYRLIDRDLYTLGFTGSLWLHPNAGKGSSSSLELYLSIRPSFRLLAR